MPLPAPRPTSGTGRILGPVNARHPVGRVWCVPGCRVVVVEDEALIRLDLVEMLTEAGYEVVGQAADGESAIRLVREHRPGLVLMDIKMPVLDGVSAAEVLAAEQIAPIVLLTAFSQSALVDRALAAGVQGYVVKPFTKADLLPTIEIARARFDELHRLRDGVADLTDKLETRKLIERAKSALQARFGWDEPTAFAWLQHAAMDGRVPMADVARRVLEQAPDGNT
jgi:AmiR/NasT family two-component response regulator